MGIFLLESKRPKLLVKNHHLHLILLSKMANIGQQLIKILSPGKQFIRSLTGHPSAHWDPFSDAVTAGPEFNKSAGIIKQQIEKLWCWSAFANMAIFTRLSKNGDGNGTHRVALDLNGCLPEDVKVSVEENVVTVEAKLEHTSTNSRLYQEWTNKYTIPKEADFKKMKYGLDDDGVFHIEAPILPTSEDVAINAPINKNYQMHDDLLMT